MHLQPRLPATVLALCLSPLLIGCGSTGVSPAAPDLSGNWQIQSAPVSGANPLGLLLIGALTSHGSNVTGILRFADAASPFACGTMPLEVITVTGKVDSNQLLTLASAPLSGGLVVTVTLTVPPQLNSFAAGTIALTGSTCSVAPGPAIAVQLPPINGTFAGSIEPGPPPNPGSTGGGTASLALTQSALPAADGSFSVNGTLAFTIGACTESLAITGTASGALIQLTSAGNQGLSPTLILNAGEQPSGTTLNNAEFFFIPSPCSSNLLSSATFTGSLTKQ